MTVLTVDFEMAFWRVRSDKNNKKNIIAVFFFFPIFIQLCDTRKIHYLTREFHIKLHLKTDIARFNVEFPRQVMNFPIELIVYFT